ncbi:hypothetical protein DJ66_1178 [Candidatus Liberibacter solanacearum]|uniref:Uncharacterized protein n=1 Tax=Candidatus Liberibacter solanacearum TaxID=556287 RepID=A0A0F4VJS3_9HYPH|nr:hypothetical protein DJ66_1178 [Candidatus Liberibacter solanacearum]
MYYNNISEELLKENLEEWKKSPRASFPDPKWHTGLGTEILNMPARAFDKLVAPIRPDDEESLSHQGLAHTFRSDPSTMGLGAHLVEGLTDLVPFWVGAQLAGRALSYMPTPITKVAGLALSGVSGLALKYAPRVSGAVSKVATVPNVGGALYAYVSNKAENSYLHQAQGLDKETADELAWRGAMVHTAAMLTPAAIASGSMAKTLASGAALNVPFGMVERGWSSKVLEDHGHSEMAKHYRVFDMEALMTDGLIGAFFGGMHSKQVRNTSLRLIRDLKDNITDRLIYKHANQSSSLDLHTSYEAHKAHMDTLAHGVDSFSRGEHPSFDQEKLKFMAENSIEDPHFKSHLPEAEPQPIRETTQDTIITDASNFKEEGLTASSEGYSPSPFSEIDEHASQRFSELEKRSPELAKEVYENHHEEAQFSKLVKDKNLFQVAIDCFLRTGGH